MSWTTTKTSKNTFHATKFKVEENLRTFQGKLDFKDFSRLCESWRRHIAVRIKILFEFTRLFKLQNVVQIQFISIQSRGGAYIRVKWTNNWVGGLWAEVHGVITRQKSHCFERKKNSKMSKTRLVLGFFQLLTGSSKRKSVNKAKKSP